ncbi:UDP-N-acetylmuramoyl-L-alanine--D-glutamate ligase [Helicobacter jaachi]|uniref:UDP-N-acetylmuramoylalanine--D-glutamate ligase n=1 Tax=Helicobacter jaachi TaxID=1677920 RepID=A0A4U8TB96_9HELI|nr:UDP-N-acetylmuramoyl-L-alanine--D-glutamate ligase [Helicobacter jaachi]TLD97190.1 UDP-N-acetylmuramoyl-L-alanine--D-glutamate ligase [Helicobacter jaachi]
MHISIFGYGVTTKPLVKFLNAQGQKLYIYDDKFEKIAYDEQGNALLPPSEFNAHNSDMEILSPGIPPFHALVQKARHLVSEYDYFMNLLHEQSKDLPFHIWISGTNGKTTTTQMTTLLLEPFGAKSGGNIGTPLSTLYEQKPKIWVLETSSFSLHYTHYAYPRIYALLPVREDHISWHGSFKNYIDDKLSVLLRMDSRTFAIIPRELKEHTFVRKYKGELITYETSLDLAKACGFDMETIIFKEPFLLDACIALSIAKLGFRADNVQRLNTFHIGAHRIAEFYDKYNRLWVDDSKGTNVDATIQAILRYANRHICIILGGDDKGANLTPLFECMRDKDIEIFSIGANEERLLEFARRYHIHILPCGTLQNAMRIIHKKRAKDAQDVVLLSPAAASLDQFSSYKQRGELFTKLALQDES